ncbi:MAG: TetR/AcrR family transcriptional regulator [Clostridia bacterium]|nr:TetR/AcrR family transcriptional regulator [Clostridia bacterium]
MKQDEMRRKLIDGAIHVISRDGLDKASTKHISLETGLNEAYIYRYFRDKEDLFIQMYNQLDEELLAKATSYIDVMGMTAIDFETRCRVYFFAFWKFLIDNEDRCLAYIRYYYSPYFVKYSAKGHEERFSPLVDRFRKAFKTEAAVWMILSHIFNVIFDFAIKVHTGQMPNDKDHSEHVFRVIYHSVEQYFKE